MGNKIIFDGNLTRDPESFITKNDKQIVSISVANTTGYKEFANTNFFKCKLFGHTAKFVNDYAKKGQEVTVYGECNIKKWEDKEGNKRESIEVSVNDITLHRGQQVQSQDNQESNPMFDDSDIPF